MRSLSVSRVQKWIRKKRKKKTKPERKRKNKKDLFDWQHDFSSTQIELITFILSIGLLQPQLCFRFRSFFFSFFICMHSMWFVCGMMISRHSDSSKWIDMVFTFCQFKAFAIAIICIVMANIGYALIFSHLSGINLDFE